MWPKRFRSEFDAIANERGKNTNGTTAVNNRFRNTSPINEIKAEVKNKK